MKKTVTLRINVDDLQELRNLVLGKISQLHGSKNPVDKADAKKFAKLLAKLEGPNN